MPVRSSCKAASVPYAPPLTVSLAAMLGPDGDGGFRRTIYLMVLALGRLQLCRDAFGRALGLTGSQYAVLIGTGFAQGPQGVSIRALAEHIQLASTHVTTEVGHLVRRGLLVKTANTQDRRSVLVRLAPAGERALEGVAPFLRQVNDLLFADVSAAELRALTRFLAKFAANGERAVAAIQAAPVASGEGT